MTSAPTVEPVSSHATKPSAKTAKKWGTNVETAFDDYYGKQTITDALEWERLEFHISQQQALEKLMRDACVYGRKFYTSDGRLIPLSSYLPRKGDPSGTQF